MNTCWDCRNDNHNRCKGGSWDAEMKPVLCSCWALHNHYVSTKKKVAA